MENSYTLSLEFGMFSGFLENYPKYIQRVLENHTIYKQHIFTILGKNTLSKIILQCITTSFSVWSVFLGFPKTRTNILDLILFSSDFIFSFFNIFTVHYVKLFTIVEIDILRITPLKIRIWNNLLIIFQSFVVVYKLC